MANQKNKHEDKAKKAAFWDSVKGKESPAGSIQNSAAVTVRDLLIGVIGGGVVGSALGRSSLVVGAVITGGGHYYKSQLATMFGMGMMASNGFQTGDKSVKGVEQDVLTGVKERVEAYRNSFKEKLFLDKLPKAKKAVNGLEGKVQYFSYPLPKGSEYGNVKELDMAALNRLEQQIAESANNFSQRSDVSGLLGTGLNFIDATDMNF